jgi:predicted unusual protein kinase regulating ubiquinone biosynthesis (AarF/ABC1/UbiB family)
MSELGFGPEVHSIVCEDKLIIFMEYLPTPMTDDYIRSHHKEIQKFIGRLHEAGYIHGDLHGGNLMLDKSGNLKVIDVETMFTVDEIGTNPLPQEWIDYGFDGDYTMIEFIAYEESENFENIPG